MAHHYLACDLGAKSGRVISGTLDDGRLSLEEIHRFPNVPQRVDQNLLWDFEGLSREIKAGLEKATRTSRKYASISTDSCFLLGVGDAINYLLSGGIPRIEVSMASTFQLYNPRAKTWSEKLIIDRKLLFSEACCTERSAGKGELVFRFSKASS